MSSKKISQLPVATTLSELDVIELSQPIDSSSNKSTHTTIGDLIEFIHSSSSFQGVNVFTSVSTDAYMIVGSVSGSNDGSVGYIDSSSVSGNLLIWNSFTNTTSTTWSDTFSSPILSGLSTDIQSTEIDIKALSTTKDLLYTGNINIDWNKNKVISKLSYQNDVSDIVACYYSDTIGSTILGATYSTTNNTILNNIKIKLTNNSARSIDWLPKPEDMSLTNNAQYVEYNIKHNKLISSIPAGAVFIWTTSTIPEGYKLCNGEWLNKSVYTGLFTSIGYTYGKSVNGFNGGIEGDWFKIPDYQGYFLRALGGSNSINPYKTSRIADSEWVGATSAPIGDNLGSVEKSSVIKHKHATIGNSNVTITQAPFGAGTLHNHGGNTGDDTNNNYYYTNDGTDIVGDVVNMNPANTVLDETRPINKSVNYIIKL